MERLPLAPTVDNPECNSQTFSLGPSRLTTFGYGMVLIPYSYIFIFVNNHGYIYIYAMIVVTLISLLQSPQ